LARLEERHTACEAWAAWSWPAAAAAEVAAAPKVWVATGEASAVYSAVDAAPDAVWLVVAPVGDAGREPRRAETVLGGTADPANPSRPWTFEIRSAGFVGTPSWLGRAATAGRMSLGFDGMARGTPSWLARPDTIGRMSLGFVGRPSWLARSETTGIFFAPLEPPVDSNDLTSERPGMGMVVAFASVGATALETAAETLETSGILSSWFRSG
jgi:hypothetical protein